jgi:hypothetical protein
MWAPFTTTGAPVAGPGVIASLLATSPRPDGSTQSPTMATRCITTSATAHQVTRPAKP